MLSRLLAITFFLFLHSGLSAQYAKIEDIEIRGIKRLKEDALRKVIGFKPGMVADSIALDKDVDRLKRLPSISHAYYELKYRNNNLSCSLVYHIEENFTLIPFANLYTSTNDEFAFRIGLQEFNLLGRNISLGGFFQYDIFNSYGVNLRAPFLFTRRLGLAFNYNNFTTQEPVFFDNTTAEYKYNNEGFEILALYELNVKNKFELGFSLFTEKYEYLFGATNPEVPLELNVDKYLFKLIYDYNDLSYFYYYLSGFRSLLNFQVVLSSDESLPEFLIGFNDFLYFARIGNKGNWASRLRLGLASNVDSPFAPFTVDNNLNIRGVGNTIDRGTGAIVINTEYRHTLIDRDWFVLQGNVFIDGGTWRNPGGDFGDFGDSQNIRIYPGVGIRLIHKRIFNAIFRIDYGYGITRDASSGFVFGIGQYF